jgi:Tfp pilus assembly protein PilN
MFTIDLLKGQGRPVRTKPQGVAIFVATFAIPAVVALVLAGYYTRTSVVISVQKQNINSLDLQIKRLSDAIKYKTGCEKEKASIANCITDVASSIQRHTQWSGTLMSLLENLPDSVIISSIEIQYTYTKKKAAAGSAEKTDKKKDSSVIVRVLKIKVSGNPSYNCDLEVRAFRDRLKASKELGPKLEDVIIASQGHENYDGRDVVTYDIECIFKPGM